MLAASSSPPLDELLCIRFRRTGESGHADHYLDTALARDITGLASSLAASGAEGTWKARENFVQVDPIQRQ